MGGSSSKATVNALTSLCVNAVQQSTSSCVGTATQAQLVEISTQGPLIVGNITQNQGSTVNTSCTMSAQFAANIQSAITNVLSQQATATGSGITSALGASQSEVTANISNMVNTNISQSQIQEAITAVVQSQTVKGTSGSYAVIGNITQAQTSSLIAKAIMSSNGAVTVVNEVANAIDQKSKAETTNPLADIFSSIGSIFTGPLTIILIIIIVIGAGLVGLMMLSGGEGAAFFGSGEGAGAGAGAGATLMEWAVEGGPML